MQKPSVSRSSLIALLSTFALIGVAGCSNDDTASISKRTASAASTSSVASAAESPEKTKRSPAAPQAQQPQLSQASDSYQQAIDLATSAVTISDSAVSRNDWNLVTNRWQEAINSLKAVPASSRHHASAQKKLSEYRGYLADAKLRATPLPPKACSGDTNPQFFSVPIKGRVGGTPIVEVSFNDRQKFDMLFDTGASQTLITWSMAATLRLPPIGEQVGQVADGSIVVLPLALVKSQEIDGRFKADMPVVVAPPGMAIGLLGQDFYQGYDIAIKEDRIEFRRQGSQRSANKQKSTCLAETSPQFFRVPIKKREDGIPVVEVSFNDKYKFPMLFDTGASDTVITLAMAKKLDLTPLGVSYAQVADGSVVEFGAALIKSQRIAGRVKRDVEVSVAPREMEMGLLGQEFFEGYNYTIKQNVIEFRRQQP